MNPGEKAELLRRALKRESIEEDFEKNFVKSIVLLAKEMGWTIEYVLEMDLGRFVEVSKVLSELYEEQRKEIEGMRSKKTFR